MMASKLATWTDAARPGARVGHAVEAHAVIGSTNDRARDLLATGSAGVAVVAEEQTSGRGRRGRTWTSPSGLNLTVSVGLETTLPATEGWRLGVAAALAARAAAADACGAPILLKWPNDLVTQDGHKVGGLLVEAAIDGDRVRHAVVGVGLNVNWRRRDMPPDLAGAATSLAEVWGGDIDRVALLRMLLDRLEHELATAEGGASSLDRYRAACVTLGRPVTVETQDGVVTGEALDVDAQGALVIATPAGRVTLVSGDVVRVRGGEA